MRLLDGINDCGPDSRFDEEGVNATPCTQETIIITCYTDQHGEQHFDYCRMTSNINHILANMDQTKLALNTFYAMLGWSVISIGIYSEKSKPILGLPVKAVLRLVA